MTNSDRVHLHLQIKPGETEEITMEQQQPTASDRNQDAPQTSTVRVGTSARAAVLGVILFQFLNGFAFNSLSENIIHFAIQQLGFDQDTTITISMIFSGVGYTIHIIGGLIGDVKLGRYRTVFTGNCFYLSGMVILMVLMGLLEGDVNLEFSVKVFVYVVGLILVAVGQGLITVPILALGAQQVDSAGVTTLQRYFRWCTWSFNLGKLVAYLPFPFIMKKAGVVYSWIPCTVQFIVSCLAAFNFIACKRFYEMLPVTDGNRKMKQILFGLKNCSLFSKMRRQRPAPGTDRKAWEIWYSAHLVHLIALLVGIFAIASVYEAIYFQMFAAYTIQANLTYHSSLSPDYMPSFQPMPIIVIVPIIELYCTWIEKRGKMQCSALKRLGAGLLCSAASALSAGILFSCSSKDYRPSIFWQIPQYSILGISEVIFFTAGFEFSYTESPPGLQAFIGGLFLGVGSFFGFVFYLAFIPLGTTETDTGPYHSKTQLEALVYSLGILMLFFMGPFILMSRSYSRAKHRMPEEPEWHALPDVMSYIRDFADSI